MKEHKVITKDSCAGFNSAVEFYTKQGWTVVKGSLKIHSSGSNVILAVVLEKL